MDNKAVEVEGQPQGRGRPTKLTDEVRAKAIEYIEVGYENDEAVPTIEGLAVYLSVTRRTLYNWRDSDDDFLYILDTLLVNQAKKIFSGALRGDLNTTISKLMLTKHGYSDRQEVDHSSSDGSMKPTVITLQGVRADAAVDDTDTGSTSPGI
jgi:hypothetical protein